MASIEQVRQVVEAAAQAITRLEPQHWPGQVLYLLEALDSEAHTRTEMDAFGFLESADGFLEAVHRDLGRRIQEGWW